MISVLSETGVTQSLSGVNHCYDNSGMESFFATLKKELLYRIPKYKMKRDDVKSIIFRYVFIYYNQMRVYTSNPGGLPPVVYERLYEEDSPLAAQQLQVSEFKDCSNIDSSKDLMISASIVSFVLWSIKNESNTTNTWILIMIYCNAVPMPSKNIRKAVSILGSGLIWNKIIFIIPYHFLSLTYYTILCISTHHINIIFYDFFRSPSQSSTNT